MLPILQRLSIFGLLLFFLPLSSQELRLKKGVVMDSLIVNNSLPERYLLYLPQDFEVKDKWPMLVVCGMDGEAKKSLQAFIRAGNEMGYVIAAPSDLYDSLALSKNILRTKKVMDRLVDLLPIDRGRIYTAGLNDGGRFANLIPLFVKNIAGTLSINAALANSTILSAKNPFHFIGIVDGEDFNYPKLLLDEKIMNGLRFPNTLLVGSADLQDKAVRMDISLSYFHLLAMSRGNVPLDTTLIETWYQRDLQYIADLLKKREFLLADRAMAETITAFRDLRATDSLKGSKRTLKRSKEFRAQSREESAARFKENLLREDYAYYLEEDAYTYNFNNLGWWNYQKGKVEKYIKSGNRAEQRMGKRLLGYLGALIQDMVDLVGSKEVVDEEALVFLHMLHTIVVPSEYTSYLKVVSLAAKNEDFGTALFYLEEALKNGYGSKEDLYAIPHTALLRITPEFNALVEKYLDGARYHMSDE